MSDSPRDRKGRHLPSSVALGLAIVLIQALLAPSGGAYPKSYFENLCPPEDRTVSYWFETTRPGAKFKWFPKRKAAVRRGFQRWVEVQATRGEAVYLMVEAPSRLEADVFVRFFDFNVPKPPGGQFSCDATQDPPDRELIKINYTLRSKHAALDYIAAHEMGHALGLGHASEPAVMSKCGNERHDPTSDDFGALTQSFEGSLAQSFGVREPLHANPSFENGVRFWAHAEIESMHSVYRGGLAGRSPSGGPRTLRFKRQGAERGANSGVLLQTLRVRQAGRAFAGVYHKRPSGGRGRVVVALRYRPLLYTVPEGPGQCFPFYKRHPKQSGTRRIATPEDDWAWAQTRKLGIPDWGCPAEPVRQCGAEITVWARSGMYRQTADGVESAWLEIDDLSAYAA